MSYSTHTTDVVSQPCALLAGCELPRKGSSLSGLSNPPAGSVSGLRSGASTATPGADLQQLTPRMGRLGIEEIPYQGYDPVPGTHVPPPPGGWSAQVAREDSLQRFDNRSTQGLDGGGRSTVLTDFGFTPQLVQWQQDDDSSRITSFTRNTPSAAQAHTAYP